MVLGGFEEDRDDVNPLIVTWLNSRLTFSYFNFLNGTKSWSYCGKSIVPWFSFDLSLIVCLLLLHRNNAPLFVATFKMYLRHHHCHHHRHQTIYIKLTLNFLFTTILFHWLINYNFILIFYFFWAHFLSFHCLALCLRPWCETWMWLCSLEDVQTDNNGACEGVDLRTVNWVKTGG